MKKAVLVSPIRILLLLSGVFKEATHSSKVAFISVTSLLNCNSTAILVQKNLETDLCCPNYSQNLSTKDVAFLQV